MDKKASLRPVYATEDDKRIVGNIKFITGLSEYELFHTMLKLYVDTNRQQLIEKMNQTIGLD